MSISISCDLFLPTDMSIFFSLFLKFHYYVCKRLSFTTEDVRNLVRNKNSDTTIFKFSQYYHIDLKSSGPDDVVGKPVVHMSALQQTTGNLKKNFIQSFN